MYDLVILGAGPGGYKAAELAGKKGMSVALIEKDRLGGVCLNEGCIPFKSYLQKSGTLNKYNELKARGFYKTHSDSDNPALDMDKVVLEKDKLVSELQKSVMSSVRHYGADYYNGEGVIDKITEDAVAVRLDDRLIEGKYLIIATGSNEVRLKLNDADLKYDVIYSRQFLEMRKIPQKALIIGGGVIGLEAACFLNEAGSKVTVIDAANHIGGNIDNEIAQVLKKSLESKGIIFMLDTKAHDFQKDFITLDSDGRLINEEFDTVLAAIGRKPNLSGFNLENSGIVYNERGIVTDDFCRTNLSNVFACGDVTGRLMLAHTAYRQAKVIVDAICGVDSRMDYNVIPRVIYTNPELLSIGLTDEECKLGGLDTKSISLPMTYSGRYFSEHGKDGARVKLIVNKESNEIAGFHMVGNTSSELSLAVELMMVNHMTLNDIENLVYAHPTVGEIISSIACAFE